MTEDLDYYRNKIATAFAVSPHLLVDPPSNPDLRRVFDSMVERIAELEAEKKNLVERNALLRTRTDLPYENVHEKNRRLAVLDRLAELEAENERLRGTWRKFDPEDDATWPTSDVPVQAKDQLKHWIATPDGDKWYVEVDIWHGAQFWKYVSHWMPVTTPVPPSLESGIPEDDVEVDPSQKLTRQQMKDAKTAHARFMAARDHRAGVPSLESEK